MHSRFKCSSAVESTNRDGGKPCFLAALPGIKKSGGSVAKLSRYIAWAILLIGIAPASYLLGVRSAGTQWKQALAGELAFVQADLGLGKLQRLRELEGDLARGCAKEALEKVRFDIDTQMYVLSSLYKDHKASGAMDPITKRDPTLSAQLDAYKRKTDSWTEPKCTK